MLGSECNWRRPFSESNRVVYPTVFVRSLFHLTQTSESMDSYRMCYGRSRPRPYMEAEYMHRYNRRPFQPEFSICLECSPSFNAARQETVDFEVYRRVKGLKRYIPYRTAISGGAWELVLNGGFVFASGRCPCLILIAVYLF